MSEPSHPAAKPVAGQAWAVFALSGAARSEWLTQIGAASAATELNGRPRPGGSVAWYSFETQQRLYERELYEDETDILDSVDSGTTGLELLLESGADEPSARAAAERFGLGALLERGYRLMSTGETRLFLVLREVLAKPALLLIEEPFEGLDARWRAAAETLLCEFARDGGSWAALLTRASDLPRVATHWVVLREGAPALVHAISAPSAALPELEQLLLLKQGAVPELPSPPFAQLALPDPLVRMRDCSVHYHLPNGARVTQFEGLNWELRAGEHTLITGPNGAGKSTLLQLLSGDHPQCYSNDLWLFGYRRGTGESVWDIKQHIGLVSAALHRDYRAKGNLLSVVVSGLYDSIGVYRDVPEPDWRLAQRWLDVIGLGDAAHARFDSLPWAQQRLALIARGLIKHPPLLILDEPTQGLDELGRHLVLAFLERLARLERTTLLFVTHRTDEQLPLFRHRLTFVPSEREQVRFVVTASVVG